MNVEEINIPHLTNEPPKFKHNLYPVPYKKHISPPYYIFVASGQRGSGKTFGICRHILNAEASGFQDPVTLEKVKIRTYLFSPTAASNPIFNSLKSLDPENIINEYTDDKLEESYTDNLKFASFSLFAVLPQQKYLLRNEKLTSQVKIEINTPPPNFFN